MNGLPLLSLIVWLPTLGALSLLVPMSATTAKRVALVWSCWPSCCRWRSSRVWVPSISAA